MAVDGVLGYEQSGSDLLVAQAIGDQPRNLRLSLAEQLRAGAIRRRSGNIWWLTKGQSDRGVPGQELSGFELCLELRLPKRRDCQLLCLDYQRSNCRKDPCASTRPHSFGRPEQLRRQLRFASASGVTTQASSK